MTTGFVWHERFMWHTPGPATGVAPMTGAFEPGAYPENAQTKRGLKNLLDGYGVTKRLKPLEFGAVADATLRQFHTRGYLDRVALACRVPGSDAGHGALVGRAFDEIARLAVGGAQAAVLSVLDGTVDNAYVLCRPPGHHAERDRGRGFCIYNNVALAVMTARRDTMLRRVAIIDWDVHHGNGTQQAFYENPEVLTLSIHQEMLYPPNMGHLDEVGEGPGEGFNVNVPLPAGTGGDAYLHAFDVVVEPALRAFQPELIVVACGFDASYFDPLGHMLLVASHFGEMAERICRLATELCSGRLVMVHEGGYSEFYVPFCGAAVIDKIVGSPSGIEDPYAPTAGVANQRLMAHQEAAIDAAAKGPLARLLARASGSPAFGAVDLVH